MSSISRPATLARAAAIGAVCGLRTFTAPSILAVHGSWGDGAPARLLPAVGVGELIADKLPMMPARSDPPLVAGRILSGALCGAAAGTLAGRSESLAAIAGAVAAAAVVWPSEQLRALAGRRTGLPDPVLGAIEDVLAVTVALTVVHTLARD